MLEITIQGSSELYDSATNTFYEIKGQKLALEHSLVSISKWESKWHKPYLSNETKTLEENIDYIRMMTLTKNVDPRLYYLMTQENFDEISNYINDPMTATWFSKTNDSRPNRRIITSELIYYWMISLNIPMECQKWHLNRLLTLIRVCNAENSPKKMGKGAEARQRAAINRARRNAHGSRG